VRGRRQQQGRSTKRCGKHGLRRAVRKTDEVAPALLAAAGLWSHLASFEVVVRFLVTASAMVVMFPSLAGEILRGRGRVRSACAVLQPAGARVQFFRRLATRRGGGKRRPVRRVTRLAHWKDCEEGT